jgi:hypothetical protein
LQCYQGINEEKAIGQFDRGLQERAAHEQERPGAGLGADQA